MITPRKRKKHTPLEYLESRALLGLEGAHAPHLPVDPDHGLWVDGITFSFDVGLGFALSYRGLGALPVKVAWPMSAFFGFVVRSALEPIEFAWERLLGNALTSAFLCGLGSTGGALLGGPDLALATVAAQMKSPLAKPLEVSVSDQGLTHSAPATLMSGAPASDSGAGAHSPMDGREALKASHRHIETPGIEGQ